MRRTALVIVGLLIAVAGSGPLCAASPDTVTRVGDLVEHAREYDGLQITLQGEAIGDIMPRGSHSWVNVYDGASAIAVGVWMPQGMATTIHNRGSYQARGDTLVVDGVFNRACPVHGGDFDIHATRVDIVAKGGPVKHPMPPGKAGLAGILLASGLLLMTIHRARIVRMRRGG